jgi:hypothetical protein
MVLTSKFVHVSPGHTLACYHTFGGTSGVKKNPPFSLPAAAPRVHPQIFRISWLYSFTLPWNFHKQNPHHCLLSTSMLRESLLALTGVYTPDCSCTLPLSKHDKPSTEFQVVVPLTSSSRSCTQNIHGCLQLWPTRNSHLRYNKNALR